MKKLQLILLSLSLLVLSLGAFAQIQNGQFTGTVTDPSGAAISNAKVTVTNVGTNLSVTTTTGSTGLYKFNELPAGTYQITAEAQGFKTITQKGRAQRNHPARRLRHAIGPGPFCVIVLKPSLRPSSGRFQAGDSLNSEPSRPRLRGNQQLVPTFYVTVTFRRFK